MECITASSALQKDGDGPATGAKVEVRLQLDVRFVIIFLHTVL